jgi:uncharacterized protein YeaO (DUF488 family)
MKIALKRVYEKASPADGCRVLVDRLWPRGVSKADAHVDEWLKCLAPSEELRKWFGHDPARWGEFRRRYLDLLESGEIALSAYKSDTASTLNRSSARSHSSGSNRTSFLPSFRKGICRSAIQLSIVRGTTP